MIKSFPREIPSEIEKIYSRTIYAIFVNLYEGEADQPAGKNGPKLTKCDATQLENRARWYVSGSLARMVSRPT